MKLKELLAETLDPKIAQAYIIKVNTRLEQAKAELKKSGGKDAALIKEIKRLEDRLNLEKSKSKLTEATKTQIKDEDLKKKLYRKLVEFTTSGNSNLSRVERVAKYMVKTYTSKDVENIINGRDNKQEVLANLRDELSDISDRDDEIAVKGFIASCR